MWGLDQEFLGSARLILARMLKTKPSPRAQALVKEHLEANDRAYQNAVQTGSSRDLYLFALSDAQLDELKNCLDREGTPAAQSLMSSLLKTRSIYRQMFAGEVYDSNRERSRLFKTTFEREYAAATRAAGHAPKVLFKFGFLHTFKGFNLLNNNDLGNHIAELAEGQSSTSLHIAVVPLKATQLRVTAIGKPYEPAAVDYSGEDSPLGFLKPLYENLDAGQWMLFDLRPLRANVRSLGTVAADLGASSSVTT